MYQILLSGSDPSYQAELSAFLSSKNTVHLTGIFGTLQEALHSLERSGANVLIADISEDPASSDQAIHQMPPRTAAGGPLVTILISDKPQAESQAAADYFMRKPMDFADLYERIQMLYQHKIQEQIQQQNVPPIPPQYRSPEAFLTRILLQLGFSPRNNGYFYLREAVLSVYRDPEQLDLVTKLLYTGIAGKYQVSKENVEKSIRQAVGAVWERSAGKTIILLEKPFTYQEKRPENTQLIKMLFSILKNNSNYFEH